MSILQRCVRMMGLFVFLTLVFGGAIVLSQPQPQPSPGVKKVTPLPPLKCCIAGEYEGYHKDKLPPTKSCPEPDEGPFKMVIYQAEKCGSKIWGEVTGKDRAVQKFTGTVSTSTIPECCNIQGVMKKPGEETKFKGTLCLKGGKWAGKGDYTTKRDGTVCIGTWEMKQK